MSEGTRRLSLDVIGAPAEAPQGEVPPAAVVLSEPMLRYACNQKGCCCSGWEIPFRLEDFLRLHEHLPPEERAELTKGIQLVIDAERKGENGEAVLHSLKLDGVGDAKACRFLEEGGGCGVHRRHGLPALPDLCVDFPGFPFRRDDGVVELWFDPVCPSVLDALDEGDAPLRLHRQEGRFDAPGLDLRVQHAADKIAGRVGRARLQPAALDRLRARCVEELAHPTRPLLRTLASLLDAFARLDPLREDGGGFEPRDADSGPFLSFLFACVGAHGPDLLTGTLLRYRRFVHAVDPATFLDRPEELAHHLDAWQPAFERWLAPQEAHLRPLQARWLAHRFGTPMTKGRAELRRAADEIIHCYGTSLRYASALGAMLQRPVGRPLYRVALGAAEYFFRSLHLPRPALPWLAAEGLPVEEPLKPGAA